MVAADVVAGVVTGVVFELVATVVLEVFGTQLPPVNVSVDLHVGVCGGVGGLQSKSILWKPKLQFPLTRTCFAPPH